MSRGPWVIALLAVLGVASRLEAAEPTSKEYVRMSLSMWAGFECSLLTNDEAEEKRLFDYGYKSGLTFTRALVAGKIAREDAASISVGLGWTLGAPTVDFQLGRWYQMISSEVGRKLYADNIKSDEARKLEKQNLYARQNCAVVGR